MCEPLLLQQGPCQQDGWVGAYGQGIAPRGGASVRGSQESGLWALGWVWRLSAPCHVLAPLLSLGES